MGEAAKKVLAYQRTPLILTCAPSGDIPEDILTTLSNDEREYVLARNASVLEPVLYQLLSDLGAAGVLPGISTLILDVQSQHPRLRTDIDGIQLPLLSERGTEEFLLREHADPFVSDLKRVSAKTEQRFGRAHLVHLALLPRFHAQRPVEHDLLSFGEPLLEETAHDLPEYESLYVDSLVRRFNMHTWIGIHPKLFSSQTIREELVERLARIRLPVPA